MTKKSKWQYIYQLWLVFAAYGVWFAIVSATEEMAYGKFWKAGLCFTLGVLTYIYIEYISDD